MNEEAPTSDSDMENLSASDSETADASFHPPSMDDDDADSTDSGVETISPTARARDYQKARGAGSTAALKSASAKPASARKSAPPRPAPKAAKKSSHRALDSIVAANRSRRRTESVSTAGSAGSSGSHRTRTSLMIDYDQSVWQWFWMPVIHCALGRRDLQYEFLIKSLSVGNTALKMVREEIVSRGLKPGDVTEFPHSDLFVRVIVDPSLSQATVKLDAEARALQKKFGYTDITQHAFDTVLKSVHEHLALVKKVTALGAEALDAHDE